jgi:hypothetical protein
VSVLQQVTASQFHNIAGNVHLLTIGQLKSTYLVRQTYPEVCFTANVAIY